MADEDTIFVDQDFRFVTVVDRTGLGGAITLRSGHTVRGEIQYGMQIKAITKEPFQLRGPWAKFVFAQSQQTYVHDVEGHYLNRLAVAGGDEDLMNELGPTVQDTTPIELDADVVEGWDTGAVDPDRKKTVTTRIRRVKVPESEIRQLEEAGGRVTAGKG
jgi:hypothetical protein